MQTILLPEFRPTCIPSIFTAKSSSHSRRTSSCSHSISFSRNPSHSFSSFSTPLKIQSLCEIRSNQRKITPGVAPISSVYAPPSNDETEDAKLAQVNSWLFLFLFCIFVVSLIFVLGINV